MERRIVMKGLGYRAFALMVVALLLSAAALAQGQGKGKPGGGGGDGDSPPSAFGKPVIAFVNNGAALMLMDAENNMKQLFSVTGSGQWVGSPSWAPPTSGAPDRIAFSSNFEGSWGLYVIDADGQNLMRLSAIGGLLSDPVWSPCNSRMVVSTRDPQNKKNQSYSTLAFVDLSFSSGVPELSAITYVTRAGKSDSYNQPAWKGGACAQ